jgi:hypothetical protein
MDSSEEENLKMKNENEVSVSFPPFSITLLSK